MPQDDSIAVRHAPDRHRYELLDGGTVVGEAHYRPFGTPAGPQRIFFHTTVDDDREGEGLGSRLAAAALEDTVAAGLTIVPVCPFIAAWLRGREEFAGHVGPVRPGHLAAVRRPE
ncbi:GNAT family N-acetyltransferase [Kocuria turfanensis]|uniref:N-acetyltransferase n=1 Tax=Kocuria turfanensis TaxID=388357 RepID=A0A512ID22_9MICC|nr:GNAT family N-acetyltransferase [Kocuria turfanensis]GEO95547.1 N-acetyltransferase [Kocuria turfanensis]